MEQIVGYQSYEEYKQAVNTVLNRTVEDFVLTGYLLKQGRDTDILKNSGYSNVNEFAWAEYKLEATQVSRYIRINDRFSEGGYSPKLQEQYQGFGYAKLALMLTLPDSVAEELTPAYSNRRVETMQVKTTSGFEATIDEGILDDYELLEMLCEVDNGNTGKLIEASVKVFGKEQYAALKEHNRDENGKISTKKMIEEITEILSGMQNGKNS